MAISDWYYAPGMYYPFWNVSVENDCAMNIESDTDMGDLTVGEFHRMFPRARKVTQEQVDQGLAKLRQRRPGVTYPDHTT